METLVGLEPGARRARLEAESGWRRPEVVRALLDAAGRSLRSDRGRARGLAEDAEWLAAALGDGSARAEARKVQGHLRTLEGRYEEALSLYAEAGRGFRELGAEAEEARVLIATLNPLGYLGRYDEAFAAAEEARRRLAARGDRRRLAQLEVNVGNLHFRLDRFEDALARYRQALAALDAEGAAPDRAVVLRNIPVCLISLGRFDEALATYRRARALCSEQGLSHLVTEADYNIAYLHYLRGDYGRARLRYRRAREVCRRAEDRYHLALCDLDSAEIALELNLIPEATEYGAEALQAFVGLGMGYEKAKSLAFLGLAASRSGRPDRALGLLAEARSIFVREGNRVWPWLIDLFRAGVHLGAARLGRARALASGALRGLGASPLPAKAALCEILLARVALGRGEVRAALRRARAAAARLEGIETPALVYEAHLVEGDALRARGTHRPALAAYRAARGDLERLRGRTGCEELKLGLLGGRAQVYERLFRLSLETLGDPAAAFVHAEEGKSRSLLDLLAAGLPAAGVPTRLQRLRRELDAHYRLADRAELEAAGAREPHLRRLRDAIARRETALRRATAELDEREGERRAAGGGAGVVPVDALIAGLPAGTAVLEYFEAEGELYALVLSRAGVAAERLGASAGLERAQRLLRFQLSKFRLGRDGVSRSNVLSEAAVRSHLRELYEGLVAPVRDRLDGDRLVVVPHGFLHGVPFHALFDGERYALERWSIGYAPSASVWDHCRRRVRDGRGGAAVFGVADERAPYMRREAERLAALLPGAKLFLGPEATIAKFRRAAAGCSLVHVAAHASYRRDNPLFSALHLADGRLSLLDIYRLRLAVDLVVLSGCGTGLGALEAGDEVLGLPRGFLYAGARSVLVTLWDAHDETTERFVGSFYRALAGGADKALALNAAMRELMAERAHPYYWAPFALVGAA